MPGRRLDRHDHTVAEVRGLSEANGIRERDAAKAARSGYAGEEPLPLGFDAVVRALECAPRAVQHLCRADARRDEGHDHKHRRPREAAAEETPVHLTRRHDVLASPALLQIHDVDTHEEHEDCKREHDEIRVQVREGHRHVDDQARAVEDDRVPDPAVPREDERAHKRGTPDRGPQEEDEHGRIARGLPGEDLGDPVVHQDREVRQLLAEGGAADRRERRRERDHEHADRPARENRSREPDPPVAHERANQYSDERDPPELRTDLDPVRVLQGQPRRLRPAQFAHVDFNPASRSPIIE